MTLEAIWLKFITQFELPLAVLLLLVLLDFISGVGAALKQGRFDWKKVGDFYRTSVLPLVLGWLTWSLASFAISNIPGLPDEAVALLSTGSSGISWFVPAGVLAISIASNLKEIQAPAPALKPAGAE